MAGFGLPIALLAGFIFGKWFGTFILVIGMTIGATILYMIGNYFFKELLGLTPQLFLVVSIGSGLEKVIEKNLDAPGVLDLIYSPDIYVPMFAFLSLIIVTIIIKKTFYKN